ncbi:hypothetical protein LRS11_16695 [Pseudomonas sp. J452]|jgi:hypothetical protein|uniref:hypothetical protein n=1 Tax=Pseudomonas sp. J452 TaxID=2898441 RepID=UPI0021ADA834|nr:hypothetical protein [Pseudomonas sp. J452]UUY07451.1 hypothetical protein LRS11_16695 [Pseudomonas sp. J452]
MKMLKALVIGSVLLVGSTQIYAADGSGRSIKMNEKFRADQKRIHGTERAAKAADELKAKATSQDRIDTDTKKETKAD